MHNETKGDLPRCQDRLQNANEKRKCFFYLVHLHWDVFHDKESFLHSLSPAGFFYEEDAVVTKLHKVSINLLDWTGNHVL